MVTWLHTHTQTVSSRSSQRVRTHIEGPHTYQRWPEHRRATSPLRSCTMVPSRQRATRAAAAALGLVAASLCCRHTAADAFCSSSSSSSCGASNHLAFAPAHGQSWLARPRASRQSAASSAGRGHRVGVRERSSRGFESALGYGWGAAGRSVSDLSSAWGRSRRSRQWGRGSSTGKLSMMATVEDAGEASSSLVSRR